MFKEVIAGIRKIHGTDGFIPLHEPVFSGNEKKYVLETIDSTFVSSVGKFVTRFEEMICEYTGAKHAVATMNGTSALHMALVGAGVETGDEVITQNLTFVATANAIKYCNAEPVLIDVDEDTLGMSPTSLSSFLEKNTILKDGQLINKNSGKRIKAVVPMHTYGFACRIEEIKKICIEYEVELVEDSAESIGTSVNDRHTGTFGKSGVFSFNGNKTITSGGGGVIITNDEELAIRLKHLTTTAKVPHKWEYVHDSVGYNYRMPNINAALACAQLENLDEILIKKRELNEKYADLFSQFDIELVREIKGTKANYWLNTLKLKDKEQRDIFLNESNESGVMTRPAWELMSKLSMYESDDYLTNSWKLQNQLLNVPSGLKYINV